MIHHEKQIDPATRWHRRVFAALRIAEVSLAFLGVTTALFAVAGTDPGTSAGITALPAKVDVSTGTVERLALGDGMRGGSGATISPDGKQYAFVTTTSPGHTTRELYFIAWSTPRLFVGAGGVLLAAAALLQIVSRPLKRRWAKQLRGWIE